MIPENQLSKIKAEVKEAATIHLNTTDAENALSHYTEDVIAVSNVKLFPSFESLADDIKEYYKNLKEVNYASWDDIHIHVISETAATFTAQFRYGFTDMDNQKTDLQGIWTALFIRDGGSWKIRLRHESFSQL